MLPKKEFSPLKCLQRQNSPFLRRKHLVLRQHHLRSNDLQLLTMMKNQKSQKVI